MVKDDGHDDDHTYEIKDCRRSFTLKAKDLQDTFVRAVRQGRTPVWLLHFADMDFTVEMRLLPGGKELLSTEPEVAR